MSALLEQAGKLASSFTFRRFDGEVCDSDGEDDDPCFSGVMLRFLDFDGDGELIGCRASNELLNITMKLLELGYAESDIRKIWGGNFFRVMREVQSVNSNRIKS